MNTPSLIVNGMERATTTLTIPASASVSEAFPLATRSLLGFITPAAWSAATLTIEVSLNGTNWFTAYDSYGSAVGSYTNIPTTTATAYAVDFTSLLPWLFVRLRSGTSAAPVTQPANRVFQVVTRELA